MMNKERSKIPPSAQTPPSAEILERFAAIVGKNNAIGPSDKMAPFLTEPRQKYFGKAAMVLQPKSSEEVSQIVAWANQTGTAIVPQGGNTGLVGGQVPYETGNEIIVSLSQMNKIGEIDPIGNTILVEAGAILRDVQIAADEAGRLFPLSLASEGTCQIGGNLAANAGGVAVLAYGNARDLTLGLEVVLADGHIWNGLKQLRKDNSGYDLKNLMIGSEGTLGIITRAVLRLFPRPLKKITILAGLSDLEAVLKFYTKNAAAVGPALTAFEFMPRIGLDFTIRNTGARDPFTAPFAWYALLEFSAFDDHHALSAQAETLMEKALDDDIIQDAVMASSLHQARELWRLRESLSEVQRAEGGSIKHDVSVPLAEIPKFIREASTIVGNMIPGARPVPFGHFGDGNIHYNVSQPVDMDTDVFLGKWEALNDAIYDLVLSLEGSLSAEHGIGRMKRALLARTKDPEALNLMRSVKQALDPKGILNPGKLL